jgi:hypothetical protein
VLCMWVQSLEASFRAFGMREREREQLLSSLPDNLNFFLSFFLCLSVSLPWLEDQILACTGDKLIGNVAYPPPHKQACCSLK